MRCKACLPTTLAEDLASSSVWAAWSGEEDVSLSKRKHFRLEATMLDQY